MKLYIFLLTIEVIKIVAFLILISDFTDNSIFSTLLALTISVLTSH